MNEIGNSYFISFLDKISSGSCDIESQYEEQLSAITTLLLEAAKVRATVEQIRLFSRPSSLISAHRCRTIFTEHSLSSEIAEILLELYSQHQENIISHLESTGHPRDTI